MFIRKWARYLCVFLGEKNWWRSKLQVCSFKICIIKTAVSSICVGKKTHAYNVFFQPRIFSNNYFPYFLKMTNTEELCQVDEHIENNNLLSTLANICLDNYHHLSSLREWRRLNKLRLCLINILDIFSTISYCTLI